MTTAFTRRPDFLPFSRPTIRQAEIDEVVDTLRSGWITTGPKAERFEREFAEYTGFPHALALSSATAGQHIGLIALGVKPGDEVITTPMTWASTVNMIEVTGATPVFVDIHRSTLQMDEGQLAAAVTPRTVGIIPVHYAGAPADMDPILAVARRHGVWVFEDAAHGVGCFYKDTHVGCFDRLGVFSFHPIKNMTTAEGGVLVLKDPDMAHTLRALRFHGLAKQAWNRYAEGGSPQVEVVRPGRTRPVAGTDVALYHVGNDPDAHGWIVDALARRPGVVVLHDWVLHHLVAERFPREFALLPGVHRVPSLGEKFASGDFATSNDNQEQEVRGVDREASQEIEFDWLIGGVRGRRGRLGEGNPK